MIDYKAAIEKGFDIIDKRGDRVPFIFNNVQNLYWQTLIKDWGLSLEGTREIILKARKEGFSSLIDAIFTIDFLLRPNIGSQIISHKDKETQILFDRVHFFVNSFCEKRGINRKELLDTDRTNFLRNKANGSYIYIGTAGAKTLGRGPTLQNIHWSEIGHFPNTEIINAEKLVVGAEEQVATGVGRIFRESTGNMQGDFFYSECERARKGEGHFKFRFFPWYKFDEYRTNVKIFEPTQEEKVVMEQYGLDKTQMFWYRQKMDGYKTKTLGLREYPTTPEEAFLAGGAGFFDPDILKACLDRIREPIKTGGLAMDGSWI